MVSYCDRGPTFPVRHNNKRKKIYILGRTELINFNVKKFTFNLVCVTFRIRNGCLVTFHVDRFMFGVGTD